MFQIETKVQGSWCGCYLETAGKVTVESCDLFVRHVVEERSSMLQGKMPKAVWEAKSQEAAVAWPMSQEILKIVPVDPAVMQPRWLDAFVAGSSSVMTEVQAAILNHSAADVREVGILRELINEHALRAPVPATTVDMARLTWSRIPGSFFSARLSMTSMRSAWLGGSYTGSRVQPTFDEVGLGAEHA